MKDLGAEMKEDSLKCDVCNVEYRQEGALFCMWYLFMKDFGAEMKEDSLKWDV